MQTNNDFSGPMNLGNPKEITIFDLAEKIKVKTNSKSKICYEKLPENDPYCRKPDISLASNMLNWKPKINLDEGLASTIEYFSNFIEKNNYKIYI